MHKKQKKNRFSKSSIISICLVASILVVIGFFIVNSYTPVNYDGFVFESPTNILLKAVKSPDGYHYSTQSSKGGKIIPSVSGNSPSLTVNHGNLIQIHLINEEKNEASIKSKHDLNIDEFNVHTGDLGYFQTKTITFLADKKGTFDYYCSIHPEMKGTITVS